MVGHPDLPASCMCVPNLGYNWERCRAHHLAMRRVELLADDRESLFAQLALQSVQLSLNNGPLKGAVDRMERVDRRNVGKHQTEQVVPPVLGMHGAANLRSYQ